MVSKNSIKGVSLPKIHRASKTPAYRALQRVQGMFERGLELIVSVSEFRSRRSK